jgi:hypothetical protein
MSSNVSVGLSGHRYTSCAQAVENSLQVSIIDDRHLEVGITAERLGQLEETVEIKIDRVSKVEAVPLSHDTFLSGGQHMCVDEKATEWLPGVTPKLRY